MESLSDAHAAPAFFPPRFEDVIGLVDAKVAIREADSKCPNASWLPAPSNSLRRHPEYHESVKSVETQKALRRGILGERG